ncbi:hypothetical protein NXH64_04795 [Butyrivibrio fibrisolvens]|uniref:hypothetical protein n=1 Tax=Pseudobutyrivibrio ruminis TaxID=46206 RepID=UPI00040500B4|nr:hypothetical protein [Pseudobutyrivibrio ruminis]MDC7278819.1 hypothetical protein [Butyrivibrio fibrisolvens]
MGNSILKKAFSNKVGDIIFLALCAAIFTASMCHWIVDMSYKYVPSQVGTMHVDFMWLFWLETSAVIYYVFKYFYLQKKVIIFDFGELLLTQILVLAAVLDYNKESYAAVSYAWMLPMVYMVGKYAIGRDEYINQRIRWIYMSLAMGALAITILDYYNFYRYYGVEDTFTGAWFGFWTHEYQDRCTMGFGLVMVISGLGYYCYQNKKMSLKISFVIAVIFSQVWAFSTTSRTEPLILLITISICLIMFSVDKWFSDTKRYRKFLVKICLIFVGIFCVVLSAFLCNAFDLYDIYSKSRWADEGGILRNVRFSMDWEGFVAMINNPLEDYEITKGLPKPHSMLLEYGRVYGFTIYVGLVLFRLLIIKDAILLSVKKTYDAKIKYLLIPLFICVNLYYAMEPNGYARRYFWMPGLLISGMIRGWLDNDSDKTIRNKG